MHPLIATYQHTLLGRLRTKLFLEIIGTTDRLPTDRELWRYLMTAWKQNAFAASFDFQLIHLTGMRRVSVPRSLSRQQVRAALREIAKQPPLWSFFAEANSESDASEQGVGCLVLGHTRPSGEPGYYASLMTEDSFREVAFVSIAPSTPPSRSFVSVLGKDGWANLSAAEAGSSAVVRTALTVILEHLPSRILRLPIDEIKSRPEDEPPLDPECMRRLELVFRKKMTVTLGTTSIANVRVHDSDFASTFPDDEAAKYVKYARSDLLVYWDGSSFISSDDYFGYLACKHLDVDEVNVAIMGDFPKSRVRIRQVGSYKLLPLPVVEVSEEKETPGLSDELKEWRAKEEQKKQDRLQIPTDLLTRWIAFAELLAEPNHSERELHEFLSAFPIILGAEWDTAESEVRFGRKFRADIVLRAQRALPKVRLIELERANHRLFTKDLHETDEVTHAVQQVSDWVRYCRQTPDDPVIATSLGVTPDGVVIIGRSRDLTEKEREVLAHNNQGRDVKVITYDEVLDDFGSLILHRLDDGSRA